MIVIFFAVAFLEYASQVSAGLYGYITDIIYHFSIKNAFSIFGYKNEVIKNETFRIRGRNMSLFHAKSPPLPIIVM
jgi:hypothetical protein